MELLKENEDAFGHVYMDSFRGIDCYAIIERDDGFAHDDYPASVYFSTFDNWPPVARKALEHVCGRVLDVGCGAGRYALHLQEKGHDVTAIDVSPLAIEVCRLRGVRDARAIPFTQVSYALSTFDTIIMMGHNFGMFGTPKRARWLLRRLKKLTTSHAKIISECLHPYRTSDDRHLRYHELNKHRGRMPGQSRQRVRYSDYVTPWYDWLAVSRKELCEILNGTGWKLGGCLDTGAPVYFAIIEKC